MKKITYFVCALAVLSSIIVSYPHKTQASHRIAQTVGNQDPDSPDFAPGEKADGSATDTYTAPTSSTPSTSSSQSSYPSETDILNMTKDDNSGGVGLFGALLFSPLVSMIFYFVGFIIFIGIIVLIIVLVTRRGKNNAKPVEPVESNNEKKKS